MSTAPKKEKGLQKYSFRGYTPEQLYELNQEQIVELFRARQRRRFARSTHNPIQKSSTSTTGSMPSARRPRRTLCPGRSPCQSRLISVMPLSCPTWWATSWPSTTGRPSTMWRSSST